MIPHDDCFEQSVLETSNHSVAPRNHHVILYLWSIHRVRISLPWLEKCSLKKMICPFKAPSIEYRSCLVLSNVNFICSIKKGIIMDNPNPIDEFIFFSTTNQGDVPSFSSRKCIHGIPSAATTPSHATTGDEQRKRTRGWTLHFGTLTCHMTTWECEPRGCFGLLYATHHGFLWFCPHELVIVGSVWFSIYWPMVSFCDLDGLPIIFKWTETGRYMDFAVEHGSFCWGTVPSGDSPPEQWLKPWITPLTIWLDEATSKHKTFLESMIQMGVNKHKTFLESMTQMKTHLQFFFRYPCPRSVWWWLVTRNSTRSRNPRPAGRPSRNSPTCRGTMQSWANSLGFGDIWYTMIYDISV